MAIYTRKGDKGKTFLPTGQKVAKFDPRIEILGTIDELNSAIGVAIAKSQISNVKSQNQNSNLKNELTLVQSDLFEIGNIFLNTVSNGDVRRASSLKKRVKNFEDLIDEMTAEMPVLKNFILPGGGKAGAWLHLSRTICRRLERKMVFLSSKQPVKSAILIYLNRLSDLLFTLARFANFKEKKKEIIWRENG
jgi:cob(I)alamin adenosyltransferase